MNLFLNKYSMMKKMKQNYKKAAYNHFMSYLLLAIAMSFSFQNAQSQSHNWTRTNPGGGGWFSCIGASKSGIVLAGSDLSGAYRSKDGGASWDVMGASKGIIGTHVSGIGFHKTNGDIMFIASGGINKTTDGGESWYNTVNTGGYITDIEFGTNNPAVGYASSHRGNWNTQNAEIYKTTDTGESWARVDTNLPETRIIKMVVDPNNSNKVFAVTGKGRPTCAVADVYRSTNGGVTWTNITANNDFEGFTEVADFAIDPNNSNTMYLTTVKADCDGRFWIDGLGSKLYKSTNGGNTWSKVQDQGGVIHINPNNSNITIIEVRATATWNSKSGTRLSTNGGNSFEKISDVGNWEKAFHGSLQSTYGGTVDGYGRGVGEDLSNPNNFYTYTNQFIAGSKDGGRNFKVLHGKKVGALGWQSNGIDNLVNVDVVISRKNPDIIYLGLADMGIWRSLDKGVSWENCNLEDGKYGWGNKKGGSFHSIIADPGRENVVWATAKKGFVLKSTDKGESTSWVEVHTGIETNKDVNGLSIDVNSAINNRTLYIAADGDVYKSTNDGVSWKKVLDNRFCVFTAVDQFNGNIVYAGGSKGLWKSTDKGANWTKTSLNDLPADSDVLNIRSNSYKGIFDIVTDPNNENWVYVSVYGKGEDRGLFVSKDQGNSWTKLLTDKYMRQVAIMPKNSDVIYATSSSAMGSGGNREGSNGIWYSKDGGQNWSSKIHDSAYPLFNAIDISNEDKPYVLAGSQGTGFQKANVPVSTNQNGVTLFGDCDYEGVSATFEPGIYPFQEFIQKFPNDRLSSVLIPECLKITLYAGNYPNSQNIELDNSDGCLINESFDNITSSVVIEINKNKPACAVLSNDETVVEDTISIYPNPAQNVLHVDLKEQPQNAVNYEIVNMVGQVILKGKLNSKNNTLSIQSFAEGMYLMRLEKSNKITTKKIMVLQ